MKFEGVLFFLAVCLFVILAVFTGVSVVAAVYGALMACNGTWHFETSKLVANAVLLCVATFAGLSILWPWGLTIWIRRHR